jgi:hypothetical protein
MRSQMQCVQGRLWAEVHQSGHPGPPNLRGGGGGGLLPVYHMHVLSPASVVISASMHRLCLC